MYPIVLIHGYSAEGSSSDDASIVGLYGTLPQDLRNIYGAANVVEIDVSRYITLNDGVSIEDVSRAFNRVLTAEYPQLLNGKFNVIIHSTGALVVRNWIRRFSPKPSPIQNLVHLAGANFGSGLAQVGQGQLAKWVRGIFQGTDRGLLVLDALDFGSSWTLDLHLSFLEKGSRMFDDFKIMEYVVIGSQPDISWAIAPIRYLKEDGSDGVVRDSSSNLNYNYIKFSPNNGLENILWDDLTKQLNNHLGRVDPRNQFYSAQVQLPVEDGRPFVPFAIPYQCAHFGNSFGVVTGRAPHDQVLALLQKALENSQNSWQGAVDDFDQETVLTYNSLANQPPPGFIHQIIEDPIAQYDPHAQVIFRVRDQDGNAVNHFDIYLDSIQGQAANSTPINKLMEDSQVNGQNSNILTFYLRTGILKDLIASKKDQIGKVSLTIDDLKALWVSRVNQAQGCYLEITATEPATDGIQYLPLRYWIDPVTLAKWIQGNRTTVVDVMLFRIPGPDIFKLVKTP